MTCLYIFNDIIIYSIRNKRPIPIGRLLVIDWLWKHKIQSLLIKWMIFIHFNYILKVFCHYSVFPTIIWWSKEAFKILVFAKKTNYIENRLITLNLQKTASEFNWLKYFPLTVLNFSYQNYGLILECKRYGG